MRSLTGGFLGRRLSAKARSYPLFLHLSTEVTGCRGDGVMGASIRSGGERGTERPLSSGLLDFLALPLTPCTLSPALPA